MTTIEVRLFGAFRKYISSGIIHISLNEVCQISEFRMKVLEQIQKESPLFEDTNLILESALANDHEILSETAIVAPGDKLAFLPPVCGG